MNNFQVYKYATYRGERNIKKRTEPHSNYYDIGLELGRGTQGITYHAVERKSGFNSFIILNASLIFKI